MRLAAEVLAGLDGLDFLGLAVELLVLAGLAGEEDQAGLVCLQALDVGSEGFFRDVDTAGVDGDADCGSELAGDFRFL